jgi:hypothetical protein
MTEATWPDCLGPGPVSAWAWPGTGLTLDYFQAWPGPVFSPDLACSGPGLPGPGLGWPGPSALGPEPDLACYRPGAACSGLTCYLFSSLLPPGPVTWPGLSPQAWPWATGPGMTWPVRLSPGTILFSGPVFRPGLFSACYIAGLA